MSLRDRRVGRRQHAREVGVVLLDGAHRLVDGLAEVGALGQVEQVAEARRLGEVDDALRRGSRTGRSCVAPTPSPRSLSRAASNFASAKRRKISPRTGVPYSDALRPEFARSSSAASQSRRSSSARSGDPGRPWMELAIARVSVPSLVLSALRRPWPYRSGDRQLSSPPAMRAIQMSEFGGPEVLELVELPIPEPGDGRGAREGRAGGAELRRHAPAHEHVPREGRAAARARGGGRGRARGHRRAGRRALRQRRLRRVRDRAGRADVRDPRRRRRRDRARAPAPGPHGVAPVPDVRAGRPRRERRRARRGGRRRLARRPARAADGRGPRHRDGVDRGQARAGARARRGRRDRRRAARPHRAARRGERRQARRRRLRDGGRRGLRPLARRARAVRPARDLRHLLRRAQHRPQRRPHAPLAVGRRVLAHALPRAARRWSTRRSPTSSHGSRAASCGSSPGRPIRSPRRRERSAISPSVGRPARSRSIRPSEREPIHPRGKTYSPGAEARRNTADHLGS